MTRIARMVSSETQFCACAGQPASAFGKPASAKWAEKFCGWDGSCSPCRPSSVVKTGPLKRRQKLTGKCARSEHRHPAGAASRLPACIPEQSQAGCLRAAPPGRLCSALPDNFYVVAGPQVSRSMRRTPTVILAAPAGLPSRSWRAASCTATEASSFTGRTTALMGMQESIAPS